jgi:hypothetical protein
LPAGFDPARAAADALRAVFFAGAARRFEAAAFGAALRREVFARLAAARALGRLADVRRAAAFFRVGRAARAGFLALPLAIAQSFPNLDSLAISVVRSDAYRNFGYT